MNGTQSKSMKDALYVQWYSKSTSWAEQSHQTVKKSGPVALAIVELCESEGIRQLV